MTCLSLPPTLSSSGYLEHPLSSIIVHRPLLTFIINLVSFPETERRTKCAPLDMMDLKFVHLWRAVARTYSDECRDKMRAYAILFCGTRRTTLFGLAVVGGRILNTEHGRVINLPIPNLICGNGDVQINQTSAFEYCTNLGTTPPPPSLFGKDVKAETIKLAVSWDLP